MNTELNELLDESRYIFNHPAENRDFWKGTVTAYIKANKREFMDTVKARNIGVAHFKGGH